MADTLELQIAQAVEAALNVASVASPAMTRPAGLTVGLGEERPVELSELPDQRVFIPGDDPLSEEDAGTGLLLRTVTIGIESRVEVPEGVSSDEALDELKAWGWVAIMADETLGGISHLIRPLQGRKILEEGARLVAKHQRLFQVQYQVARNDPRAST